MNQNGRPKGSTFNHTSCQPRWDRTESKIHNSTKKQNRNRTKITSDGAYDYVIPSHEPKKKHKVYYQECNICMDTHEPCYFDKMCYQCKEKICDECYSKTERSVGYCNNGMLMYFKACPFCRYPLGQCRWRWPW